MGGPSNSGVISTKSEAGLTRIMFFVSKELGLKLQETTQQVVKEMSMLLHTLLSQLSGLTVPAQQELLPEGIPLQTISEVVTTVVGGRGKATIKKDRVVHVNSRHEDKAEGKW